jgi:hypothetical protein
LPLLYVRSALPRPAIVPARDPALLAVSIPHVLYAAEARFYSLFVLTTLLNLARSRTLPTRRDRPCGLWSTARSTLFFFSGLFSLFVWPCSTRPPQGSGATAPRTSLSNSAARAMQARGARSSRCS